MHDHVLCSTFLTAQQQSETHQPQYGSKPCEKDEVKRAGSEVRGYDRFLKVGFTVGFCSPLLSSQRKVVCLHAAKLRLIGSSTLAAPMIKRKFSSTFCSNVSLSQGSGK